jgi:amino acid adenylation domain-containing protein
MNTLPMRLKIKWEMKTITWLKELRETQLKLRDYDQTPLLDILGCSEIPRGTHLFDSILIFDNYDLTMRLQAKGGPWKNREFRLFEKTGYPLTLYVYADKFIKIKLAFTPELYNKDDIQRLLGHFKTIIEGFVLYTENRLADIPILTEYEKHKILNEWNDTYTDFPSDKCTHQFFEEQALKTPNKIAVICKGKSLTYNELNIRSNQLARKLQTMGVGPEILVGVCLHRSLNMVVAVIGILKAGGAYIPLDPEFPKERIIYMIEDSKCKAIVAEEGLIKEMGSVTTDVILIDRDWDEISKLDSSNLESNVTSDNLSYVIYTSGSTGKPKGVMVQHKNVVNFFKGMDQHIKFSPQSVWIAVTSLSFDISVLELFWTLSRGLKVVIYKEEDWQSMQIKSSPLEEDIDVHDRTTESEEYYSIPRLIEKYKVSHMQCTPSMAKMVLLDKESETAFANLDYLIIGGETFPVKLANQLKIITGAEILNMYGPTETTIWSTAYKLDGLSETIPIGKPIANTETFILDNYQQPVPINVPGELYIGGEGVVRGYFERPELTSEKFIPHLFNHDVSNNRIYRTGDLARYREDGIVEFLGRLDNQVKIRGYRIELGEIEKEIGKHLKISEAVVIAREDTLGDKKLIAYIVAANESIPSAVDLRDHLKETLPEYMIPFTFVRLERLPLTPNGKLDRLALPEPVAERPELEKEFEAPRTDTEKTLSSIWGQVLGIEQISINDNFFDLGGHSLSAVQASVKINQSINVELSLRNFFQAANLAELASSIEEKLIERPKEEQIEEFL